MDIHDTVARTISRGYRWPAMMYSKTKEDGLEGFIEGLRSTGFHAIRLSSRFTVNNLYNPGTPIWEREWDVLVILDACRHDLMLEVADDHAFLGGSENVESVWSVGSKSSSWMRRNFDEQYRDEIEQCAYITGNPFTATADIDDDSSVIQEVRRTNSLDIAARNVANTGRPNLAVEPAVLEEVWKTGWDDDLRTIPPRPLTDTAIQTWRNKPPEADRMIVHYMQPHAPFVPHPELGEYGDHSDFGAGFGDIWAQAGDTIPLDTVWEASRDNLEYVLEDVELLVNNIDADTVVISADHGNAMGELGYYGHSWDIALPSMRRVPWVEIDGTDSGLYEPTTEGGEMDPDTDVEDRLRSLGYK